MGKGGAHHPQSKVNETQLIYIAEGGNMARTAKLAGVAYDTIKSWATKGDWNKILDKIQEDVNAEIAAQEVTKILSLRDRAHGLIDKCMTCLELEFTPPVDAEPGWKPDKDPVRVIDACVKVLDKGAKIIDDEEHQIIVESGVNRETEARSD